MLDESQRSALEAWLRDEIGKSRGRPLGRGYQAAVHVYDRSPVGPVVVKQAHHRPLLSFFTTRSLARERDIYERLEGIPGIPRCFGLIDDRYLVLEHIDGRSLRNYDLAPERRGRFFDRLLETLRAMHRAGVAHADLKRKDNILVGPDERPYVIDFGIAYARGASDGRWARMLFDLFRQMDYNAWIKLKYRRRIDEISSDDARLYRPLWVERIARWLRIPWQKITLRRFRKRRQGRRDQNTES